jgi:diguanylate cyclase (GGDEF)-like protein
MKISPNRRNFNPNDSDRRRLRAVLLLAFLGLQFATLSVATVAWRSSGDNIVRKRVDSEFRLAAEQAAENISAHLQAPARLQRLLLGSTSTIGPRNDKGLETLFLNALRNTPEASGVFIGRSDGSFLFVTLSGTGVLTKQIEVVNGQRTVRRLARANFHAPPVTTVVDDPYDPRTRTWYRSAIQKNPPIWSDVYKFATSKLPGITTASLVNGTYSDPVVVGVDVELSSVDLFVEQIQLSEHGSALLVDSHGTTLGTRFNQSFERRAAAGDITIKSAVAQHLAAGDSAAFRLPNTSEVLAVKSITGSPGWRVVLSAPESDFLTEQHDIQKQLIRNALLVGTFSALLAFGAYLLISRRVRDLSDHANVDSLTQILNRRRALELAHRTIRRNKGKGQCTYLCILDIDWFKSINDTYGHIEGDHALRVIAQRLGSSIRDSDLLGRYGGEEFIVVLSDMRDLDEATSALSRICRTATDEPIEFAETLALVTLSGGIVEASPSAHLSVTELVRRADSALYEAKQSGRNRIIAYSETKESFEIAQL